MATIDAVSHHGLAREGVSALWPRWQYGALAVAHARIVVLRWL